MRNQLIKFLGGTLIAIVALGACSASGAGKRHRSSENRESAEISAVDVNGITREYIVNAPPTSTPPAGYPVILVFHGGGGTAKAMMKSTEISAEAGRSGFITVYPQGETRGLGGKKGFWDLGAGALNRKESSVDDVLFVKALLKHLSRTYPIDQKRIYAAGMSLGGMFTYRLGCEMSDTIAAIAVVEGTLNNPSCRPMRPVPLMHIHGLQDENVPLDGGKGRLTGPGDGWPSALAGIEKWKAFNRCDRSPIKPGSGNACQVSTGCQAPVVSCLLNDHGHAWPGTEPRRWQEKYDVPVRQDFNADRQIVEFFNQHKLP